MKPRTQCLKPSVIEQETRAAEKRLIDAVEKLRATREAQRYLDAEERSETEMPTIATLRYRLGRPRPPVEWSIPGWQPANTRVMLVAQFKAGKTTLVGNYLRSRLDGEPWLDVYDVVPLVGTAALIDVEMNAAHLDDWLAAQQIRADDRLFAIPLKGQLTAFNILDSWTRAWWAAQLQARNVSCLVLDCLRPVLDALGLDEHTEAGKFLVAFDALLREADISDAIIVQHMGHLGDRARGDSRLRDWPDVEWRLVRQDTNPRSPRFLSAYGRDVDQPEQQLAYDSRSRRMSLRGGSRQEAATENALDAIVQALRVNPEPRSGRRLKDELAGSSHGRNALDRALHLGQQTGRLVTTPGPQRAILYHVNGTGTQEPT